MASSRIVNNYKFNKLKAIRLDTVNPNGIRANTIGSIAPSYLFSVLAMGTFTPTTEGGLLEVFDKDLNIIQFTDRPLRQTSKLDSSDFYSLFLPNETEENTFNKDPPNAVLIINGEQRTFEMRLDSVTEDSILFNLSLKKFENESNISVNKLENQIINLFIDGWRYVTIGGYTYAIKT